MYLNINLENMPENDYIEQAPVQRDKTTVRVPPVEAIFARPALKPKKLTRDEKKQQKQADEVAKEILQEHYYATTPGRFRDLPLQEEHPGLALMFAPEFRTYGLVRGSARVLSGLAGSHIGSDALGRVGQAVDNVVSSTMFEPTFRIIGGLGGYGLGSGTTDYMMSLFPRRSYVGPIDYRTYLADNQTPIYNPNQITGHFGQTKYYGPTMGKTTATASNPRLIDFDDLIRQPSRAILDRFGFRNKAEMYNSGNQEAIKAYEDMLVQTLREWRANPQNQGLTLMASPTAVANPQQTGFYFDNVPSIPSRDVFIARNVARGATPEASALWYDSLIKQNPNLKIDNRFVSQIERRPYQSPTISRLELIPQAAFTSEVEIPYNGEHALTARESFDRFNATGKQRALFMKSHPVDLRMSADWKPSWNEELTSARRDFANKYAYQFDDSWNKLVERNANIPEFGYSVGTIIGPRPEYYGSVQLDAESSINTPLARVVQAHEAGHATGNANDVYIYKYLTKNNILDPNRLFPDRRDYYLGATGVDRGEISAHLKELPDWLGLKVNDVGSYINPSGKVHKINEQDVQNYINFLRSHGWEKGDTIWDAINPDKMKEFLDFLNQHKFSALPVITGTSLILKEKE